MHTSCASNFPTSLVKKIQQAVSEGRRSARRLRRESDCSGSHHADAGYIVIDCKSKVGGSRRLRTGPLRSRHRAAAVMSAAAQRPQRKLFGLRYRNRVALVRLAHAAGMGRRRTSRDRQRYRDEIARERKQQQQSGNQRSGNQRSGNQAMHDSIRAKCLQSIGQPAGPCNRDPGRTLVECYRSLGKSTKRLSESDSIGAGTGGPTPYALP